MKNKVLFASALFIFVLTSFIPLLTAMEYIGQETQKTKLASKYKVFLVETEMVMTSKERDVFQNLKSDQERDLFIMQFWNQRGGRVRGVRANISMLRVARMVQFLDLTDKQVAVIMPEMNKNEKQKQELQRDLQLHMRDLRILLRSETPEKQKLEEHMTGIKTLKASLLAKEIEFEKFLADNLSLIQQANYIIFSQEFYQGLQEQLNDARRTQQGLMRKRRIKK
jgi:hypothetical protein